ncbi:MAG: STAS domain-containing protein [Chloroflexi bacterium]|nr:STAS domain-containing protein [Chloroflexota bacterium]
MSTAPMPMSAEVTVLQPQGRLDASFVPGLDRQLQSLLGPGIPHVVVDLAQVTYVSSSALRVLLVGLKRARSLGGDLRLSALRTNVLNVFKITGFVTLFGIYETREEAVHSYTEEAKSGQEK